MNDESPMISQEESVKPFILPSEDTKMNDESPMITQEESVKPFILPSEDTKMNDESPMITQEESVQPIILSSEDTKMNDKSLKNKKTSGLVRRTPTKFEQPQPYVSRSRGTLKISRQDQQENIKNKIKELYDFWTSSTNDIQKS